MRCSPYARNRSDAGIGHTTDVGGPEMPTGRGPRKGGGGDRRVALYLRAAANAWLSDDAYITFRTVDNFVQGMG